MELREHDDLEKPGNSAIYSEKLRKRLVSSFLREEKNRREIPSIWPKTMKHAKEFCQVLGKHQRDILKEDFHDAFSHITKEFYDAFGEELLLHSTSTYSDIGIYIDEILKVIDSMQGSEKNLIPREINHYWLGLNEPLSGNTPISLKRCLEIKVLNKFIYLLKKGEDEKKEMAIEKLPDLLEAAKFKLSPLTLHTTLAELLEDIKNETYAKQKMLFATEEFCKRNQSEKISFLIEELNKQGIKVPIPDYSNITLTGVDFPIESEYIKHYIIKKRPSNFHNTLKHKLQKEEVVEIGIINVLMNVYNDAINGRNENAESAIRTMIKFLKKKSITLSLGA